MANLTSRKDLTGDFTSMLSNYDESSIADVNNSDDSDQSDTVSPSLPSLPMSLQQQLEAANQLDGQDINRNRASSTGCPGSSNVLTVKEFETKLDELRRENFSLKLRLYFMEKDKNGIVKPECESMVAKELLKREKALKAYQKIVDDKDCQLASHKYKHDQELEEHGIQLESLRQEKEAIEHSLAVSTAVCKSLMSHLSEIREFWQQQLVDKANMSVKQNQDLINWFNTSEDLLNSASVLITDDNESRISTRRQSVATNSMMALNASFNQSNFLSHLNLQQFDEQNSHQANNSIEGTSQPEVATDFMRDLAGFASRLNFEATDLAEKFSSVHRQQDAELQNQMFHLSSESDTWSEPDRHASRARIGIEDDTLFSLPSQAVRPVKSKPKRRQSGMSSLGLLSDISEIMAHNNNQQPKKGGHEIIHISTAEAGLQTDLTILSLDEILEDYRQLVNRTYDETGSQTEATVLLNSSCQTDAKTYNSISAQVETLKRPNINKSIGTCVALEDRGTQVIANVRSVDVQVDTLKVTTAMANGDDVAGYRPIRQGHGDTVSGQLSPNSLYTFKTATPVHHANSSSSTSSNQTVLRRNNNEQHLLSNTKSCPVTPSKQDSDDFGSEATIRHGDQQLFKVPSEQLFAKVKKANISRCSKIMETMDNESNALQTGLQRSSSSSSSSVDSRRQPNSCPYGLSTSRSGLLVASSTKQSGHRGNLSAHLAAPALAFDVRDSKNVSSPDLGLGDSDGDLVNLGLRAYLTLGNYQLLRGQINESISVLNSIETLNNDFSLRLITSNDLVIEVKPFIVNLNQLLKSSKNLCRAFSLEDSSALLTQLEKMTVKKENMEKAISRQLKKTDKLLKKATVNLKDAH